MKNIQYYNENIYLGEVIKENEEILNQEGLMVCNLSDIIEKYKLWVLHLPRVTPFYAIKCNDDTTIIRLLNELGCGFDCASKKEIDLARELGISSDRIIYANPCKQISHLNFAKENEVHTMTFDSENELLKIKKYFPTASLLLRFRCDAAKSLTRLGEKYGCDVEFEAVKLLEKAKKLSLNIVGIAFHVGSGCKDFSAFQRALKSASFLIAAGKNIGFNMPLLDIGGGFPGDCIETFIIITKIINKNLDLYFPNENEITIIAEPGRYFVTSAQTLITDIHSKRLIERNGEIRKIMYYITDGVFGSLNYLLYDHDELIFEFYEQDDFDIWNKIDINNTKKYKCMLWGPTCDSTDQILDDIELPNFEIGTKFIIKNCGAYAICLASGFNGFSIPKLKHYMNIKDKNIFESNQSKNNFKLSFLKKL